MEDKKQSKYSAIAAFFAGVSAACHAWGLILNDKIEGVEVMSVSIDPVSLNTLGLSLDILGVILLFLFGLLPALTESGGETVTVSSPEGRKIALFRKWASRIAIFLIVVGFGLQISSNYVT